MEYLSVTQFAEKYGISERTARNYCAIGKIEGAFLTGKTWNIPADAALPPKGKKKIEPMDLSTPLPMPEPEKPLMLIDDDIDLDGNIKPGKPGLMIE